MPRPEQTSSPRFLGAFFVVEKMAIIRYINICQLVVSAMKKKVK